MKALLIGDNSSNPNWGGRGASIALYQILEQRFQITGTISGSLFLLGSAGFGYINTFFPRRYAWFFSYLLGSRKKRKVFDYYLRLEEFFGAKDFISTDPAETVRNILASKDKYPPIGRIYDKVAEADLLIVNGEGDLVFTTPPRREALFLLGLIALGIHLGKKAVFVNALVSDCPTSGRNKQTLATARSVLSKCSATVLRDRESFAYVREEMPEIAPDLIPDSLFTWYPIIRRYMSEVPASGDLLVPFPEQRENFGKLDFSRPYVCVGGSAAAVEDQPRAEEHFCLIVERAKSLGLAVYLTENDGRDGFLRSVAARTATAYIPVTTSIFAAGAILANARLFISGRYHPTILASMGGTPCIFLGSSAHKMRSLQQLLEYDCTREFPVFPTVEECDEMMGLAREYLDRGEPLRERIRDVAKRRGDEAARLADLIARRVGSVRPAGLRAGLANELPQGASIE